MIVRKRKRILVGFFYIYRMNLICIYCIISIYVLGKYSVFLKGWWEKNRKKWKCPQYQDLSREMKKNMEHESNGVTNCNWHTRYIYLRIGTWTGGFGNKRTSGALPNYSIVEFSLNTEKSSRDLSGLSVTQKPMENYQLMMVCKTLKWVK